MAWFVSEHDSDLSMVELGLFEMVAAFGYVHETLGHNSIEVDPPEEPGRTIDWFQEVALGIMKGSFE